MNTKVMLGIGAALAAGFCFADVTSANIVGYQKVNLNLDGAKMLGAPFICVNGSAEKGFWLSDLRPEGYLENTDLVASGTDGDFSIQLLNTSGHTAAKYSWVHAAKKKKWSGEGYWNDPSAEPVIPHGENDHYFAPGSGMWTFCPDVSEDDSDATYSVTPAGEVCTDSVTWHLPMVAGAAAFANPYPVSIWLSDLIVEGYLDNTDLVASGTDGDFSIQLLNKSGHTSAKYSWVHASKKKKWSGDGYWNDPSAEPVIAHSDNDLQITSSMGLWIFAPDRSDDDPEADYFITVNYPTAD